MTDEAGLASRTYSCLCVTEDRPEFCEWLLWNYRKQDHPRRELVIVDSSHTPIRWPDEAGVRVVRCAHRTPVSVKRNIALQQASGDAITWFDDDDWQHPRKLSLLDTALQRSTLAGNAQGWFLDIELGRARRHLNRPGSFIFNSVGLPRAVAAAVAFEPKLERASDTPWLTQIRQRLPDRPAEVGDPLFFWLCHKRNLSNAAGGRRAFNLRVEVLRAAIGDADWQDTDEQLGRLRAQLLASRPGSVRTDLVRAPALATGPPDTSRSVASRPAATDRSTCIVITTYDRPESLGWLLDDIERQWQGDGLSVLVFDDAGTVDVAAIEARIRRMGWTYLRAPGNHGKRRWWVWWNTILATLRQVEANRYFVLQDDIRLCDRFFERAGLAWSQINDDDKASLFLHVDNYSVELGKARWTPSREAPAYGLVRSGWVDLTAFVCERRLFEALDWRLHPNAGRWGRDPSLGSGVGAQISTRLAARGLTMYRVSQSLTVHANAPSKMNPEARARWPVRTRNFIDGEAAADCLATMRPPVLASLASVPARERLLETVVRRLLPQVDRIGVYLNGYVRVPSFLADERIEVADSRSDGDRGDAGKFFWADRRAGYVVTCDDDIDYPPDYMKRLIEGIERYGRRAVVGFHGATLHEPLVDYYRSRRLHHFAHTLARDTPVHVLGTGVAGYHSSTWEVRPADFVRPNMADIYLGLAAQERQVPFICLRHEAGWLRELPARGPVRSTSGRSACGQRARRSKLGWPGGRADGSTIPSDRAIGYDPGPAGAAASLPPRRHRVRDRAGTAPPRPAAAPGGGPHHPRHPAEREILRGRAARPDPTTGADGDVRRCRRPLRQSHAVLRTGVRRRSRGGDRTEPGELALTDHNNGGERDRRSGHHTPSRHPSALRSCRPQPAAVELAPPQRRPHQLRDGRRHTG